MSQPPFILGPKERRFLTSMAASGKRVFRYEAAVHFWTSARQARKALSLLVKKGWLKRLRRGLYILIPLEAGIEGEWSEDPLVIAAQIVPDGAVAYWTALHHWNMTEQIARTVFVQTCDGRYLAETNILGVRYHFVMIKTEKCFGALTQTSDGMRFRITDREKTLIDAPVIVKYLQTIERVRETVRLTILPPMIAEQLRLQAHVRSTHYSTRIEGNRLTLKETEQVIHQRRLFPGMERDVKEVERYYQALQQVEKWVAGNQKLTETRIQKLHSLLNAGRRAKPTPYRDGQNVIREASGEIVYMPPEASDVPVLMNEMVQWIHQSAPEYPIPVIAGITHYQFVTIHPFYDGNGRTARTLTTWILYQGGYDLGKFYALEEFYAEDLGGYYDALVTHPHHNYYFGRNDSDITPWLDYFLKGMAVVFERVAEEVEQRASRPDEDRTIELLRPLDYRARRVLGLFAQQEFLVSSNVANLLGVSLRQARDLLVNWVEQGWLEVSDPSRRGRKYRLADPYHNLLE